MLDLALDRPISEYHFVAVDTETTGLRVTDRPVEIGAVRLEGGAVTATYQSLVDPEGPVPAASTAVHGITDSDLAGAPAAGEVLAELEAFGRGAVWLAHNAGYDAGILGTAYARIGQEGPTEPMLDTCRLARACLPGRRSYRLEALGRGLGLAEVGYHRALADAHVAAGLFLCCTNRMDPQGRCPLSEVARRAGGWLTISGVAQAAREVPHGYEELQRAISEGLRVAMRYGGSGGVHEMLVSPKVIFHRGGHDYLEAFCFDGRFVKSYRLDRLQSYEVLPPASRRGR